MSLAGALRQALTDFYFNSWRLAPANLVWGVGLIALLIAGPVSVVGAVILALLAIPLVGLHRMAALVARDEPAGFSDFLAGMRRYGVPALAMGAASVFLAFVLTTNIVVGIQLGGPVGWFVSAMALYGDVALAMLLVAFWPLLVDPKRQALSLRGRLAMAAYVVIGRPLRMLALTFVVGLVLAISTVLFAALVMVSVAYVSLVSSRYVLPLADEVEQQLAARRAA
jgi:uncharacterized membrane protein YesL